jgi:DUF971 family protein
MRASKGYLIRKIEQIDNHNFLLTWNDGIISAYRLSTLEKNCPCAHCIDEMTGKRRSSPSLIDENVKALKIQNIGRYALKVHFTSGCSTGIYDFDLLRNLSK